ncbi:MAG: hypothetical protein ACYDC8_15700 [Gammaproteobacteria bacterium]
MSQKNESGLAWVWAAIGLVGAGFTAGMHRLIWSFFLFLTVAWGLLCLYMAGRVPADSGMYVMLAIVIPVVVGFVVKIIEGVANVFFGALSKVADLDGTEAKNKNTSS